MDKKFLLDNIRSAPVQKIFESIRDGIVTFEECQETGKFDAVKQNEVEKLLKDHKKIFEKEQNVWQSAENSHSANSYEEYLNLYPDGKYAGEARKRIESFSRTIQEEKATLIERILLLQDKEYTPFRLNQLIEEGRLTKADLYQTGRINERELEFYFNPPAFIDRNTIGWTDLPDVIENGTDVYFFGVQSSGKSCLLAGLLYYAKKKYNRLEFVGDNSIGEYYAEDLIRAVELGVTPPPTPAADEINYISTQIPNPDDPSKLHRLNFIEMSGEFFSQSYRQYETGNTGSLRFGKYLHNNNQKIIFLVVDYDKSRSGFDADEEATQDAKLARLLRIMEKEGLYESIDAIHIVLTKADLLPGGVQNTEEKIKYMKDRYGNLLYNVESKASEYRFKSRMYPFSLGDFKLFNRSYDYDEWSSEKILLDLLRASTYINKNRKGRWGFFK